MIEKPAMGCYEVPVESKELPLWCVCVAHTSIGGAVTALKEFVEEREGAGFSSNAVGRTHLLWGTGGVWALDDTGLSLSGYSQGGSSPCVLSVTVRKDPNRYQKSYVRVELYGETGQDARALHDAMVAWWPVEVQDGVEATGQDDKVTFSPEKQREVVRQYWTDKTTGLFDGFYWGPHETRRMTQDEWAKGRYHISGRTLRRYIAKYPDLKLKEKEDSELS